MATMTTTERELCEKLEQLQSSVEKASKPRTNAELMLGGFQQDWKSNVWPTERLSQISKAYPNHQMEHFCRSKSVNTRYTGMGPALVKLAALASGQSEAMAIAKAQGMSEGYNFDSLEAEYGFTTVSKAKTQGVPGWNSSTKKVLLNERRKTALAENSGQTGGYVVPPQFISELLTIAGEEGFVEQRAKVIPMTSRTAQWPMLDITTAQSTGTSPYFGGILAQWQPEAASISESEPAFRQAEWTAWDLVMYTVSSNQLLADNGIGLDALLTQLFGQAITWYKEYAFLRGTGAGSSMPLGVINAPATYVQSRAVANRFTLTDAAAMMSRLQVRSWDDACWVMHQSVLPQLIQMASGAVANTASTTHIPGNQLVWLNPSPNSADGPIAQKLPKAFLNGLPIFFTEKVPNLGTKGDVMLVDWSRYVIGMRMDMQIDVSPHYLFRTNQLAWRVIARCDGKPWLNSYITDANGWVSSPFVALNT